MARRGTIRNAGRVAHELADARHHRAEEKKKAKVATLTHLDYAEEAESAQRGTAWPQAAALWRRAAQAVRVDPSFSAAEFTALCDKYEAAARECDAMYRGELAVEQIAKTCLRIPTLEQRGNDESDFHEMSVRRLKHALMVAYQAGREDMPK